jgi:N-acyl-D-amino-acid deacylase
MYASNSELGQLCTVLNEEYEGAYYAPHHRSYGHKAMESYEEMLNLSRTTGCPVRKSSLFFILSISTLEKKCD